MNIQNTIKKYLLKILPKWFLRLYIDVIEALFFIRNQDVKQKFADIYKKIDGKNQSRHRVLVVL